MSKVITGGIAIFFILIVRWGQAIIAFLALLSCCDVWWDLHWIVDCIILGFLSGIPLLSQIMGFIGVSVGWGFGWLGALAIFVIPWIIIGIMALLVDWDN
jgi:hypothetical protein